MDEDLDLVRVKAKAAGEARKRAQAPAQEAPQTSQEPLQDAISPPTPPSTPEPEIVAPRAAEPRPQGSVPGLGVGRGGYLGKDAQARAEDAYLRKRSQFAGGPEAFDRAYAKGEAEYEVREGGGGVQALDLANPSRIVPGLLATGIEAVFGKEDTLPGNPIRRVAEGGFARELVNRTSRDDGTIGAEIDAALAAWAGGMLEMGLDPLTWVGMGPSAKGVKAVGNLSVAAGHAVRPIVSSITDETVAGAWLARGKKGPLGVEVSDAILDWQGARHAVTIKSESEGAKVAQAFKNLKDKPGLEKALHDFDHYGTPIPDEFKEGATDALAVYRRTRSEMAELSQAGAHFDSKGEVVYPTSTLSTESKKQYPVHMPRFFREPLEEAARKGRTGRPRVPGIQEAGEREDAFNLTFKGLDPKEVEELVYGRSARPGMFGRPAEPAIAPMPRELQPFQPTAPTMSKGTIEKVEGGTFVKFPNTEEGRRGANMLQDMIQERIDTRRFGKRSVGIERTDPILKPDEALELADEAVEAGLKGPKVLTPITDAPTIIAHGWRRALQNKANDTLFRRIAKAQDMEGAPVSVFVPEKWVGPGQRVLKDVPEGYVLMENVDPKRNWGVLMDGEEMVGDKMVKGAFAVKEDVAKYISNLEEVSTAHGDFVHDLADAVATEQISGLATTVMSEINNNLGINSINGTSRLTAAGRRFQNRASRLAKDHMRTGVLPRELEPLAPYLSDPVAQLSGAEKEQVLGFVDQVDAIFEQAETPFSRPGQLLGHLLTGSPFAKSRVVTAAGGAAVGATEESIWGRDPLTGAAAGAGLGLLGRWTAPMVLNWMRHGDKVTTIAAFLKHKDDFIAQGLSESVAIEKALEKTVDLTIAGRWGRLGGLGEAIGSAPGGMVGTRTPERGYRKFFLNRFVNWPIGMSGVLYNAVTKYGVQEQIGGAITVSALAGLKYGGRRAVVGTGLLTEEEADRAEARYPGAFLLPTFDAKTGKTVASAVNGRAFSGTPLDMVDFTARGLVSKVTGSGSQAALEAVGGESLFTGAPLGRTETDTATPESRAEAVARSNLRRFTSPYGLGGRLVAGIREGIESAVAGEVGAPTPGEIVAGTLVGKVRTVDPARDLESLKGAFHAEANKVSDDYRSARSRTRRAMGLPILDEARDQMSRLEEATKVADLFETYIDKGVPADELLKSKFKPNRETQRRNALVRKILIERGRIKAPTPGIPGLEK